MSLTKVTFSMIDGGIVNAKDFGAVGDGTVDDGPAIQAAIDGMLNGQTLYIPSTANYYRINATNLSEAILVDKEITIVLDGELRGTTSTNQSNPPFVMYVTANNVVIKGSGVFQGNGTTVQNESTGVNRPGLLRIDGNNVTVEGLSFVKQPEVAIFGYGSDYLTVQNCTFKGYVTSGGAPQYYAVNIEDSTDGVKIVNSTFVRFDSTHSTMQAIAMVDGTHSNALISGNFADEPFDHFVYCNLINSVVSNNTANQTVAGSPIKLNAGYGNVVIGNTIVATESAIDCINQSDLVVVGNKVAGVSSGFGISVYDNTGGTNAMNNVIIANNILSGEGTPSTALYGGIRYEPTAISSNCLIECNVIGSFGNDDTTYAQIYCVSAARKDNLIIRNNIISGVVGQFGVYVAAVQDCIIEGNQFTPSGGTAPLFRAIRVIDSTLVKINGNYVRDVGTSATLDTGIQVDTTTNYTITNNTILGWSYAGSNQPWDFGASTKFGNACAVDPLIGTVTLGAAATTTVTNANICTTATTGGASSIRLTPLNASAATLIGSAKCPYISTMTPQTSFVIATASGASAAGTEIFQYEIVQ
jgi:hypothetical protein